VGGYAEPRDREGGDGETDQEGQQEEQHTELELSIVTIDVSNGSRYARPVIRSFRDAETRKVV
jgi:hypothetical protein